MRPKCTEKDRRNTSLRMSEATRQEVVKHFGTFQRAVDIFIQVWRWNKDDPITSEEYDLADLQIQKTREIVGETARLDMLDFYKRKKRGQKKPKEKPGRKPKKVPRGTIGDQ